MCLKALALLLLIVYTSSLQALFLLDNDGIILKDQRVHEAGWIQVGRIFTGQYWENAPTGLYRPLTTLSFLCNYAVWGNGANPVGYHWFNLILHTVNVLLAYVLVYVILREIPLAFLVSACWGLHPVLTESVTNIVGRSDLLAGFGVLAALLAHRRALQASGRQQALWNGAALLAMAIGIFSKESAIVAVGVLALYDLTFRPLAGRSAFVLSYGSVGLPCLAYLGMRAHVLGSTPYLLTQFVDNPLLGAGFWQARLTAMTVVVRPMALVACRCNSLPITLSTRFRCCRASEDSRC